MPVKSERRLLKVGDLAAEQSRVIRLRQLSEAEVSRSERESHVTAERWRAIPYRGVVVDRGPVEGASRWWQALVEVGSAARLGGVTALQAAGVTGLTDREVHVWVVKSTRKGRPPGVVVHESRRWDDDDALDDPGIPRARPAVAAVQAALWARTPREAAFLLMLPVQQRVVRVESIAEELARVRRHAFRRVLEAVAVDVHDGVRSMNELDFAVMCRERGLPEPSRQTVRWSEGKRSYLDVEWSGFGVTLEVQGAHHGQLLNTLSDDVRLVRLATEGGAAVSVSVLTLRVQPEPFFVALAQLLAKRGWTGTYRGTP
jgi:hypothetical protein